MNIHYFFFLALQSACDSVNRGLLAPVYNMRAFKALSLMAAPWLLPIDLTIVLGKKYVSNPAVEKFHYKNYM